MAKQLHELEAELADAISALSENRMDMTGAEIQKAKDGIKNIRADIQAILTEGAEPCPECGNLPFGMIKQPRYFFIGCATPGCEHRRSRGDSVALAVAAWNGEVYFERSSARIVNV